MKTRTQRDHEESGCNDYLQHNADSCPTMNRNEIEEIIHKANGDYQDADGVWWTLDRLSSV